MVFYLFFLILSFLPLIEGELLGIGRFLLLASCLPLSIYLYKSRNIKTGLLDILFAVFLFFATLSTIFSSVFARSLTNLLLYFAYFIYFLTAGVLAKKKKHLFQDLLFVSLLFPSLVLCFLSFYLLFIKEPPPFSTMNLIFANFGHNHLVDFLIFSFPLSLALFFKEQQRLKKTLFLLLNLIFLSGFILSFSRGGVLIAILIIFLFELSFWKSKKQHSGRLYSIGIGLLLSLVLGLGIVGNYYLKKEETKFLDNSVFRKAFRQIPFNTRLDYWRQAILGFSQKPLLGWGLDNFRYLSVKYQSQSSFWSWYTHNHFLQMFVETGVFTGLSFAFLIALLTIFVLNNSRGSKWTEDSSSALKIGFFASIIHSFFDFDWQLPSVFLFFWVIAGFLIGKKKEKLIKIKFNPNMTVLTLFLGLILFIAASLEFSSNLLLVFGAEKRESGNYKQAEAYYQKGLAIWPFKLENWHLVIHYHQTRNKKEKVLRLMNKLMVLEPINDKNFKLLGDLFYEDKGFEKAIRYYQQAIDLNPLGSLDVYLKLLDIWSKKENNSQQLFEILQKIEELKGDKCLLKCLGFDNEEKILNLLLQLIKSEEFSQLNNTQQARIYFWLAILTTSQQDWDKDIGFLQKAVSLDNKKEYQEFLSNLFLIKEIKESFWQKDFKQVEQLAQPFLTKEKDHAFHQKFYIVEAYYFLAEVFYHQKEQDKAWEYWQKGKEICPWDDISYLGLARILEKKNDLEKAKEILEECLRINPWSDDCQKMLSLLDN